MQGKIPTDFKNCIVIQIPKKNRANKCEQYQTLSLVAHASEILASMINSKTEWKINIVLTEDQFASKKGWEMHEAILDTR